MTVFWTWNDLSPPFVEIGTNFPLVKVPVIKVDPGGKLVFDDDCGFVETCAPFMYSKGNGSVGRFGKIMWGTEEVKTDPLEAAEVDMVWGIVRPDEVTITGVEFTVFVVALEVKMTVCEPDRFCPGRILLKTLIDGPEF